MAILVVGGDSRLSRELIPRLVLKGNTVYATTRRSGRVSLAGERSVFLDLADIGSFTIPPEVEQMVVVGGVVDYGECTNQPGYACRVNCENIPALAGRLLERGGYVCFISTNTVFKFKEGLPDENSVRCPGFSYAQIKAQAEERLETLADRLNARNRLGILRLTKNVGRDTSPFGEWLKRLSAREVIRPFSDLYFAPVRFSDSAYAIEKVLERAAGGVFHLSGERDIDYAEFARGLCRHLGLPETLILGMRSTEAGVKLTYNHPITALGMLITEKVLGLKPVPLRQVYDLLGELMNRPPSA